LAVKNRKTVYNGKLDITLADTGNNH